MELALLLRSNVLLSIQSAPLPMYDARVMQVVAQLALVLCTPNARIVVTMVFAHQMRLTATLILSLVVQEQLLSSAMRLVNVSRIWPIVSSFLKQTDVPVPSLSNVPMEIASCKTLIALWDPLELVLNHFPFSAPMVLAQLFATPDSQQLAYHPAHIDALMADVRPLPPIATLTTDALEQNLIVVWMVRVRPQQQQLAKSILVPSRFSARPVCTCVWMEVVLRSQVCVNHSCASLLYSTATLAATQTAAQVHPSAPLRIQFYVPMELASAILLFVELHQLVVLRTQIALEPHLLLVHKVLVLQLKMNVLPFLAQPVVTGPPWGPHQHKDKMPT